MTEPKAHRWVIKELNPTEAWVGLFSHRGMIYVTAEPLGDSLGGIVRLMDCTSVYPRHWNFDLDEEARIIFRCYDLKAGHSWTIRPIDHYLVVDDNGLVRKASWQILGL